MAIGLFVAISPYLGLHLIMVVLLAWILRANKAAALAMVWVSNPATFLPIYLPSYWLGAWMLGLPDKDAKWWEELRSPPVEGWWNHVTFEWHKLMEVFWPLVVGTTIVGLVLAACSYYATVWMVRAYRVRRLQSTPAGLRAPRGVKGHAV